MGVFVVSVFRRYAARRQAHFLFWGIGLTMFGIGSFAEAFLPRGWNQWVFFSWYLFGAALNAAWISHGTLNRLVRKRWINIFTAILTPSRLWAAYLMFRVMPDLDTAVFTTRKPISEQCETKRLEAGEIPPAGAETAGVIYRGQETTVIHSILPLGSTVRLSTPFFYIYGLVTLVGGAIYSAYLFWQKSVLPNKVIGYLLIAVGALSIGFASSLTRLGYGQFLYLGELLAAILMNSGFVLAAKPQTTSEQIESVAAPAGD